MIILLYVKLLVNHYGKVLHRYLKHNWKFRSYKSFDLDIGW